MTGRIRQCYRSAHDRGRNGRKLATEFNAAPSEKDAFESCLERTLGNKKQEHPDH